jgi:hypothetical protein
MGIKMILEYAQGLLPARKRAEMTADYASTQIKSVEKPGGKASRVIYKLLDNDDGSAPELSTQIEVSDVVLFLVTA